MQRVVNDRQVDYYSFEAQAGTFYVLWTDLSRFSPNNVITVFDPDHMMVGENNDGSLYPNDQVDARIIVRPERSGTYYVTVEDRTAMGDDEQGHFIPPPFYKLSLREITAGSEGFALGPGPITLARSTTSMTRYVTLLGELKDTGAIDTFEIQGLPDNALIGRLLAAGVHGDGSTAATVSVRVTAESDGHLLAGCGLTSGQTNIHPPVDDAQYRIRVSAGDQVGANGFYAIDLALLADNPHERADADNNDPSAAEPIVFTVAGGRRGLLLSRLPAGDVDYYSFSVEAGEMAAVRCEGESGGSGVRGLHAEVQTAMAMPLAAAGEASPKPLAIEPFKIETSGTYFLKLSSDTPAAGADDVEPWVRCAVLVGR